MEQEIEDELPLVNPELNQIANVKELDTGVNLMFKKYIDNLLGKQAENSRTRGILMNIQRDLQKLNE